MKKLELSQREVILHWMLGQRAKRYGLYTDGVDLYSYDAIIGYTGKNNVKFIDQSAGRLTWSQLRHLDIMKEEFGLLANASDINAYLRGRLLELQKINVQLKLKGKDCAE